MIRDEMSTSISAGIGNLYTKANLYSYTDIILCLLVHGYIIVLVFICNSVLYKLQ